MEPLFNPPRFTLGADTVLGWTTEHQEAVKAWLAEAVGERTMLDTYEVQMVGEGRIRIRYYRRGDDGRIAVEDGEAARETITVDWPKPPPRWGR
jgi:hypothetical protein